MENVKVQAAICKCGGAIKIAVTETKFNRKTTREFAKLMEDGYEMASMTVEQARVAKMCFGECGMIITKIKKLNNYKADLDIKSPF